jgi:hypothetical protein
VKDSWASCPFYDAVLGFMGYRRVREDDRGFDWELSSLGGDFASIGLMKAEGAARERPHDRYSPGLHHLAWHAHSREDVTVSTSCCSRSEQRCSIRRPIIRGMAKATTPSSSATQTE